MNPGSGRLPVPAIVEFLARCALAARRRYLPAARAAVEPRPAAQRVEPALLAASLAELGIGRGDLLMVHSGMVAVERLGWEPSDLIDFLLDYLGPQGTLAMPTHPKLKSRDGRPVYDVRRSPSRVGLVTELFRRRAGAIRSRFPFAAAAAMGARAEELVVEHEQSWAPHDERSPYAKLSELGGKALCIGVATDRMTILHVAEDCLRDALPIANFHEERRVWVVAEGEERQSTVHIRSPWLWWFLNLQGWTYTIHRRGFVREQLLAGVPLRAVAAHDIVEWMKGEIRSGKTIYPLAWMNRWLRLGDPALENST